MARKGNGRFLKRYRKYIDKIREIREEWNLEFEIDWILDIQENLVKKGWISKRQRTAIENALQAVLNMKKYKKLRREKDGGN